MNAKQRYTYLRAGPHWWVIDTSVRPAPVRVMVPCLDLSEQDSIDAKHVTELMNRDDEMRRAVNDAAPAPKKE